MKLVDAHKLFHDTLGISLNPYLDGALMAVFGKPVIDIARFDEWLHRKFGEYEDSGFSMEDVLTRNYGKAVSAQVSDLLGLEMAMPQGSVPV